MISASSNEAASDVRRDADRFRMLVEHASEPIWTMTLDGRLSTANASFGRVLSANPEELVDQPFELHLTPSTTAVCLSYLSELGTALETSKVPQAFHGELDFLRGDGSIVRCDVQLLPHLGDDQRHPEILGLGRDLSEHALFQASLRRAREEAYEASNALRTANEELRRLATTDPLTGARNRLFFEQAAKVAIASRDRYGQPATMLMLDLDHFKAVNDRFGHQTGDQVLKELVGRILGRLRVTDSLVRWGGEEFIVLMTHISIEQALPAAEQLRALVAAKPFDGQVQLTVSIGVAQLSDGDSIDSWVERADEAMYAAKAVGRDVVYSAG